MTCLLHEMHVVKKTGNKDLCGQTMKKILQSEGWRCRLQKDKHAAIDLLNPYYV